MITPDTLPRVMTLHKLSAGDGYLYLIRQVAASDATSASERGYDSLGAYYAEKGESPGVWAGRGLESLQVSGNVTEQQMKNLFGLGIHPDAQRIEEEAIAAGMAVPAAASLTRLGSKFPVFEGSKLWRDRLEEAYHAYNTVRGELIDAQVPDEEKSRIRTEVALAMFSEKHGRAPIHDQELTGFIAQVSRPESTAVAGFDLTFTPVKSLSTLWATAPREVADLIEQAHDLSVEEVMDWAEDNITYTRIGRHGVAQVDTRGLVYAKFKHRDSRAGDPNLHTHVPVSSKVQTEDGRWLALDARSLYWYNVAASERYNTALEANVVRLLGGRFEERPGEPGKRPIREYVGVDQGLSSHWSSRRQAISERSAQLSEKFVSDHGRMPTAIEMLKLAQQANLNTRQAKHSPRTHAEQRASWLREAVTAIGRVRLDAQLEAIRIPLNERRSWIARSISALGGGVRPEQIEHIRTIAAVALETAARERQWLRQIDQHKSPDSYAMRVSVLELIREANRTGRPTPDLVGYLAHETLNVVSQTRANFRHSNIDAEAARQVRLLPLNPELHAELIEEVTTRSLRHKKTIQIGPTLEVGPQTPAALVRRDGTSVFQPFGAKLYTTQDVIAAETRILQAAGRTDGISCTEADFQLALLEFAANNDGRQLNTGQEQMARSMATSGRRVQLALAPAGTGKSTTMGVVATAVRNRGGNIVALAPQAGTATVLSKALGGAQADTLHKLVHEITHTASDKWPEWIKSIDADTVVIIDEAGLAGTQNLDAGIAFIIERGGSVILVGDDRQRAAAGAGGVLRDVDATYGSHTLYEVMRFQHPAEGAASLAMRSGDTSAVGFYLDEGRLHAVTEETAVDTVYRAWQADIDAGHQSMMIAPRLDQVAGLNALAQAERIRRDTPDLDPETAAKVALGLGDHAYIGDTVLTKQNNRMLSLGGTDYVKNGDFWTVQEINADGSLTVKHRDRGVVTTLPADYVATEVRLGYALTLASVQGETVGDLRKYDGYARALFDPTTTCNDLYMGLTRAITENHGYAVMGSVMDDHAIIKPESVSPQMVGEAFVAMVEREGSARSATTQIRDSQDPMLLLGQGVDAYTHSIDTAAVSILGQEKIDELTAAAETAQPDITLAPAWPTLLSHLAILTLQGQNAITRLEDAISYRELDTADDVAAVLDWRLDNSQRHSQAVGALPWIPAIPAVMLDTPEWAEYLTAREQVVTDLAAGVRAQAREWNFDTAPTWALPYLENKALVVDLAVWRAANAVNPDDIRPTGDFPMSIALKRIHKSLTARCNEHAGVDKDGQVRWAGELEALGVRTTPSDPYWPVLSARLNTADAAGLPVREHLAAAIKTGPLPAEYPLPALWYRLTAHLSPVTAPLSHGTHHLRPTWTSQLATVLGQDKAERIIADRLWPNLVTTLDGAVRDGLDPEQIVVAAAGLLQAHTGDLHPHELATALLWRVSVLTDPAPLHDELLPPDPDDHDLQAPAGAWELLNERVAQAADPTVREPELTEPGYDPFDPELYTPPADLVQIPQVDLHEAEQDFDSPDLDRDWEPEAAELAALFPDPAPAAAVDTEPADHELQPADPETAAVPDLAEAESQAALGRARSAIADAHAWWKSLTPQSWVPAYVAGRGFDPADFAFAPPGWTRTFEHLSKLGYTEDELLAAGLIRINSKGRINDIFHGRAVLPLTDPDGSVVAFIGRKPPGDVDERNPKYVNSPTTELYRKSSNLYGLNPDTIAAIQAGSPVVVVEGPMDAKAITHAAGGSAVAVATNGTALTMDHMRVLQRTDALGRGRILTLAFDGDDAGRAATIKAHALLTDLDINDAQAIVWQAGKDASQLLEDHGPQAVRDALSTAKPLAAVVVSNHLAVAPAELDQRAQRALVTAVAPTVAQLDPEHRDTAITELLQHLHDHADGGQAIDAFTVLDEISNHLPTPAPDSGPQTGGLGLPPAVDPPGTTLTRTAVDGHQVLTATQVDHAPVDLMQEDIQDLPLAYEVGTAEVLAVDLAQPAPTVDTFDHVDLQEDIEEPALTNELGTVQDLADVAAPAPAPAIDNSHVVTLQETDDAQALGLSQDSDIDAATGTDRRIHEDVPDVVLAARSAETAYDLASANGQLAQAQREIASMQEAIAAGQGAHLAAMQQQLAQEQARVDAAVQYRELVEAIRADRAAAAEAAADLGETEDELAGLGRFAGKRREVLENRLATLTQQRDFHRGRIADGAAAAKALQPRMGTPEQQARAQEMLGEGNTLLATAAERDEALVVSVQRATATISDRARARSQELQELQTEQQHRESEPDQSADLARQEAWRQKASSAGEIDVDEDIPGQREWDQDLDDQQLGYDFQELDTGFER